jgi:arginyl-tRNA synthetase
MSIAEQIKPLVSAAIKDLYAQDFSPASLTVNTTKPEFEGDYTVVLFSFVKQLKPMRRFLPITML